VTRARDHAETVGMGDVTKFSGIFANMATDYARSAPKGRAARPARTDIQPTPAIADDETAIRTMMERAIARRLKPVD